MTNTEVLPDIEIARRADLSPLKDVAAKLNIPVEDMEFYGHDKAKLSFDLVKRSQKNKMGKLILVTAISPTPAGEGKTTTSIGLGDAMNRIGKQSTICLREPSLGPCFGMKGGATGGGYAQVIPMDDINLHFTGDFHAIGTAHNLLSAMVDNHMNHSNSLGLDARRVVWKRVVDMNDRALRNIVVGLGGPTNGVTHESGYDITVASEIMAIFCLSQTLTELRERLGKIIVGYTNDRKPITAADLKAHGAMTVLLRNAFKPNLVQTLENNPVLIHGGPFANIAHGCNSVTATKLSMALSDYTITEAGFGADLGAEKFLNIKCRKSGLKPDGVVLVATIRALKMHGGVEKDDLATPNAFAVKKGLANLDKHIENIRKFGLPVTVAINAFTLDTDEEMKIIETHCQQQGVRVARSSHWADGGAGAEDLARATVAMLEEECADFKVLYPDNISLWDKVRIVAQKIYGANDILGSTKVRTAFRNLEADGFGELPVCLAKTQYSFSTDPKLRGRPKNFDVEISDVKISAGAGFVVVLTGNIMTMPGLPRVPAAEGIDIDADGNIVGLS